MLLLSLPPNMLQVQIPRAGFEGKGRSQAVPRHREQRQWRGRGRNRGSGTGVTWPPVLAQVGQKVRLLFLLWEVCPWGSKGVDEKAGSCAVDEINEFCHV